MTAIKPYFLVFLGGALGTLLRYGTSLIFPDSGTFPLSTFTVNILGSFGIGVVYALLIKLHRRDPRGANDLNKLFGNGLLGGFTTYSLFAYESFALINAENILLAIGYSAVTIVLGVAACLLGVMLVKDPQAEQEMRSENG